MQTASAASADRFSQFNSQQSLLASAGRLKSKSTLQTQSKSAHKRNKPSTGSLQNGVAYATPISRSTSKLRMKPTFGSNHSSPKAVDVSFANENRFPTSGAPDEGIDSIKNASLYDLIKIQMDQHVKQTKQNNNNKKSKEKLQTFKTAVASNISEVDDSSSPSRRPGKTRNQAGKSQGVQAQNTQPSNFLQTAVKSVIGNQKKQSTTIPKQKEKKIDLMSSFKVEMIDLKALHATQPASANVTPGRMSSAARMRPVHSNKPSMREQSGWMTHNQGNKVERVLTSPMEEPRARHVSPKKTSQISTANSHAKPKKQSLLTQQKNQSLISQSVSAKKVNRSSAKSPFQTSQPQSKTLEKNSMTSSKARLITQLAKRKPSSNQVEDPKPSGRYSLPTATSTSKMKKKQKKQTVPQSEKNFNGSVPSASQYSTSLDAPSTPPHLSNDTTPKGKKADAISIASKSTPLGVVDTSYGSKQNESEKRLPVASILVKESVGQFGLDQNPQTPTTPQRVTRAERSRSKSERLTGKKQKNRNADLESQTIASGTGCLSDNETEKNMIITPTTSDNKRVSMQKHSEKLHQRLEELKQQQVQKPKTKQKQPEISVAQMLLERLKHNMDQQSPNFESLRPTSPKNGNAEVVKIGALMQTAQQEEKRGPSKLNEQVTIVRNDKVQMTYDFNEPKIINTQKERNRPIVVEEQTPIVEIKSERTIEEFKQSNQNTSREAISQEIFLSRSSTVQRLELEPEDQTPAACSMSPAVVIEQDLQEQSQPTILHQTIADSDKKLKQDASLMEFVEESILQPSYKTQPQRPEPVQTSKFEESGLYRETETPEAEPPLLLTPERKPKEMPMLTDQEFEQFNERQETKVFDMFEDDLLEITQDEVKPQIPTKTEEVKKPKPSSNFTPSPMKPTPKTVTKTPKGFSRKHIRSLLNNMSATTFDDLLRIKRPSRQAQLIGQSYIMLLWIFKEAQSLQNKAEDLLSVPYQNLEDEFENWENVQAYVKQDIAGIHNETQAIATRLPLPKQIVEHYLKKMQHKVAINDRLLARSNNQSLDKMMSLVKAVLDWHLNSQSSLDQNMSLLSPVLLRRDSSGGAPNKRRGSAYPRPDSAGNKVQKNMTTFSRKTSTSKPTQSQPVKTQEARNEKLNKFAQDNRQNLKNKYQQYKPLLKKAATVDVNRATPQSPALQHSFLKTPEDTKSPREISKQVRTTMQGDTLSNPQFIRPQHNISASPKSVHKGVPVERSLYSSTLASRAKSITPTKVMPASRLGDKTTQALQRPYTQNSTNTLALMKANSEQMQNLTSLTTVQQEGLPPNNEEENLDSAIEGGDEVINLVVNNGSPSCTNQLDTYNYNTAVVTSFAQETVPTVPIAEVTEDPSTNQTMPGSGRKTTQSAVTTYTNLVTQQQPQQSEESVPSEDEYGGPIAVYEKQESDNSSQRSFKLEPTNIGEYYSRQNELHAQLQQMLERRGRHGTAELVQMLPTSQEDCYARTTQTLKELREKHLLRMKQPASPTSNPTQEKTEEAQTSKVDEWRDSQVNKIMKNLETEERDV